MARRIIGGAEGRRLKKETENREKLKRPQNTQPERKTLIIACEDEKSAPFYFQAMFDKLKKERVIAISSLVIANHTNTHPTGVLEDLLNHKGNEEFDHRWIFIDRDEERTNGGGHTLENFNQAFSQAKSKKIKVAYANPCFEIWVLLHFEYRNTAIDRDELYKKLESEKGYVKNELFMHLLDPELQITAIENSKKLLKSWKDQVFNPATNNPSTNVHELVELLNKNE
jgi:hypothetical protein